MDVEILIPLAGMVMVGFLAYTVVNGLRRWYEQRALSQFQSKLLEKIVNVSELGAFLSTDAGAQFLKGLTTVSQVAGPHTRILRAIQSGAVLTTLGIGLYLYGWLTVAVPWQVTNAVNAVATILFGIGVGFLVAAAVSYRLSRRMGLLEPPE